MSMQKAIIIEEFGDRSVLKYSELSIPEPGEGEVQINIRATSINPVEFKIRNGFNYPHEFPIVLGWDIAGVISKVGYGVSQFKVGDEVYAYGRRNSIGPHYGTYCQYSSLPASFVAMKPASLSFEEAACLPLVGLTAYQSLVKGCVGEGSSVLIVGASGGVGSNGIEIAKNLGATVIIGVASQRNFEFMTSLGATHCLDYKSEDIVDQVKGIVADGVDMVFDCYGSGTLMKFHSATKVNGWNVSIADWSYKPPRDDINADTVFVCPHATQLAQMAEWIDGGKLTHKMTGVWEWEQIVEAHEQSETGHTRGKMALKIPPVEE